MSVIPRIAELHPEMTQWRQRLHAHPETAFEEHETAGFVAAKLEAFGLEVTRGLAGTGVVGTLRGRREGNRCIGLRADLDALDIEERTGLEYRSSIPGKMHACGHDGHTTMLLGAARYLAETRDFAGTVHFIFQPAEENEGGARVMVEEGLFARFPVDAVFGLHNWPGLAEGRFAVRPGPVLAAFDIFEITVRGTGSHAAMPHLGADAVVAAAHTVLALQSIASRRVPPLEPVVVSATQVHGGEAYNVLPAEVVVRGTARAFRPQVQDAVEAAIGRIAAQTCAAYGAECELRYERRYPPMVNAPEESELAAESAARVVGAENVLRDLPPAMNAEDFAFMLREKPGAYVLIGNGSDAGDRRLHNPGYDFNDAILPLGASYWVRLVERSLAPK